jgi:uncharacterized protein YggE
MVSQKYFKENKVLTTYVLMLVATFIFLFFVNYFNISYPLTVTQKTASSELAVTGVGKVDVSPDLATVNLSIVANNAKTVQDAQNEINSVNNKIVESLKSLGVSKKDIKTSDYSITPNYDYSNGKNTTSGYNASATLTVTTNDTSKLPQIISKGTESGANQVLGTNYSVKSPEDYQEQARQKAIDNAKQQAQKLANELGIKLGKAVNIAESSQPQEPSPVMYKEAALSAGSNPVAPDLQPGSQTITSTVTVYFETK